jgi:hypothetical protein
MSSTNPSPMACHGVVRGHFDADELVIDARHTLIEKGLAPEGVKRAAARIQLEGSPYGKDKVRTSFREWFRRHTGAICWSLQAALHAPYTPPHFAPSGPAAVERVDYQILDPEPCCGSCSTVGDFSSASCRRIRYPQRSRVRSQIRCLRLPVASG